MKSIYEEYIDFQNKHEEAYGPLSICFMHVGSFYEVYSFEELWITNISEILGVALTRKNKSLPINPSNPYMLGVPIHVVGNFISKLIDKGYCIALISQEEDDSNKNGRKLRKVSDIITPSTYISDTQESQTKNIMVMYILKSIEYRTKKEFHLISCIICDPITSKKINVYENVNPEIDDSLLSNNISQLLLEYNPIELFVITDEEKLFFSISSLSKIRPIIQPLPKYMNDKAYRSKILEKTYPLYNNNYKSSLSITEFIGLEKTLISEIALCCMLEKLYEFSNSCVRSLEHPTLIDQSASLSLENNAKKQLDIDIIIDRLNKCKTPMGRRLFTKRLGRPKANATEISQRFKSLEEIISTTENIPDAIKNLQNIKDINNLLTRIEKQNIQPKDMYNFIISVQNSAKTLNLPNPLDSLNIYNESILQKTINIDTSTESVFLNNIYPELDTIVKTYSKAHQYFEDFSDHLHNLFSKDNKSQYFNFEFNQKDGPMIVITKKRWTELHSIISNQSGNFLFCLSNIENFIYISENVDYTYKSLKVIKRNNTHVKLSHALLDDLSNIYTDAYEQFKPLHKSCFINSLTKFHSSFSIIEDLSKKIAIRDVLLTCAHNMSKFNYCIPTLHNTDDDYEDRLIFKGLRHPLIEGDGLENICVPNDISFGNTSSNGILLYGINSAGKSSLMKAIGIAVIMAQAGMPVPAKAMSLKPFTRIFTRIEKGDDILAKKSTFITEMIEFRNIQRLADKDSLIIGDELCAGTEHDSAVAIVAAGVIDLSKKNSTFIFATHLHKLAELECIKNLKNVCTMHLKAYIDKSTKKLCFDRKLSPGTGDSIHYGIEICAYLDMEYNFIRNAESIRKELMGQQSKYVTVRKSHYNAKKILDMCDRCHINTAEETHHIIPQKNFRNNTSPFHMKMNALENLESLCKKCHLEEHLTQ
jgi:DNA mismatch repair protein MutS